MGAFLVLGVAPTLLTSGWCYWRHRGQCAFDAAAELSRQLELTATLEGFQYLRPGAIRYRGITLADPETGRTLLRCGAIDVQWTSTADWQGNCVPAISLAPAQIEITAEGWQELGRVIQRVLAARLLSAEPHLRLATAEILLHNATGDQMLSDVQGLVRSIAGGVQADFSFRVPGASGTTPMHVVLVRNRQTTPPLSAVTLQTGGEAIPCSLLAALVPDLPVVGTQSRFGGQIDLVEGSDGWHTEVRGEFSGFDLNELGREGIPHLLGGPARLELHARFHQGRMEEAAGTLAAGRGMLGRSLIASATQYLALPPIAPRVAQIQPSRELVPYDELVIAFLINAQGLRIEGRCPSSPPGTILADQYGPLLSQPAVQPLPLAAFIHTVCADNQSAVVGSRLSERLSRVLPIR